MFTCTLKKTVEKLKFSSLSKVSGCRIFVSEWEGAYPAQLILSVEWMWVSPEYLGTTKRTEGCCQASLVFGGDGWDFPRFGKEGMLSVLVGWHDLNASTCNGGIKRNV